MLGTCIVYLADSDTIENGDIGLILKQIPELVQLLFQHSNGLFKLFDI